MSGGFLPSPIQGKLTKVNNNPEQNDQKRRRKKKSKCGIFLIAPSPFDPSLTCGFEIWHFIVPYKYCLLNNNYHYNKPVQKN